VQGGIDKVSEYFKTRRAKVFRSCVMFQEEIGDYQWEKLKPGLIGTRPDPEKPRKIKDECFAVARTLLNLRVLGAVPGLLQATLDAAVSEVEHRAADGGRLRGDSHEPKGPLLTEEARVLMELISDLWAHRAIDGCGWSKEQDGDADDAALPRKRARTLDPCVLLLRWHLARRAN
jgi:hypothetical protein